MLTFGCLYMNYIQPAIFPFHYNTDNNDLADVQGCRVKKALQRINKRLTVFEQKTVQQLAAINSKLEKCDIGGGGGGEGGGGGGGTGPYNCGGTGGWRRVVHLDTTNPSATCPKGWRLTPYSKRTCGRDNTGAGVCDSVSFPVSGGQYTQVCGRVKAYQQGLSWGFYKSQASYDINGPYMDGVSVTHGSPRKHIWTFASGDSEGNPTQRWSCPCDATVPIKVPPFVGNDYFCEAAVNGPWLNQHYHVFHVKDPMWDAKNCLSNSHNKCCLDPRPPYFVKKLSASTSDDIEVRLCLYDKAAIDDIAVEVLELYVK